MAIKSENAFWRHIFQVKEKSQIQRKGEDLDAVLLWSFSSQFEKSNYRSATWKSSLNPTRLGDIAPKNEKEE